MILLGEIQGHLGLSSTLQEYGSGCSYTLLLSRKVKENITNTLIAYLIVGILTNVNSHI
jgi:hypothetical protein